MKKGLIWLLITAVMLSFGALAHPGRTDSSGGHKNSSTGEYHYHHGYPAHQHENGECPYDFKDKTGKNSGSSNSSNDKGMTLEKWYAIINPTATPAPIKKQPKNIGSLILPIVVIGPVALFTALLIVYHLIKGFLNFASWLIWQFAKGSYEYRTLEEIEDRRKIIRLWRINLYGIPCCLVFVGLSLLARDESTKVSNVWVLIGVGITIGVCWVIERLLSLLFHALAEWARKYRKENY